LRRAPNQARKKTPLRTRFTGKRSQRVTPKLRTRLLRKKALKVGILMVEA
jgi:hypothetical protein